MGDDDKQVVAKSSEVSLVSPYTLFSSDNPGALITLMQLKGDNYNEWAMEMLNALRAKKKVGFIDGSLAKPKEDSKELEAWLSRFDVGNKVRVHQLMEQLASCRQNGQAVIDYYGRMAVMWEELQTYKPPPACTCSDATTYEKEREDERVHQFIMGLDDSKFGNVVTAITEADELPDLGKVYAKVIREEARINSSKGREGGQEAIGFVAKKETSPQTENRELTGSGGNVRGEGNRGRDRTCYHCGKPGHEKNSCWQLVGYPEWITDKQRARGDGRGASRGTGRGGYGRGSGRGAANVATASSSYGAGNDLTPEQWNKITQIIQERKSGGGNEKLSVPCLVGFADGGTTTSTRKGDLVLSDTISLKDDRSSKTLIGAGEERDGVYYFKDVSMARGNKADGSFDLHQTTCVYTPQQNGRVERKHRHILNVARAMLFQANLPVKFWGEAISSATHVINMTPSKILQGKSPYEVLFGKKPHYSSLRVFGSLCYAHRKDRSRDKFGPRSRRCIFVGYPFGKKGWRVYDTETNDFLVLRDFVFKEDVFPFQEETMAHVDETKLTGGPDDDWVISTVSDTEDRGR
ncbi:uncharacterized protein LOC130508491 [Raphanus sativus]|uniref:Uncharacterized protein LOC130508491 n=1 Tax=Raphanus sativus TaxID=3726 RepID=A0A9W3D8C0_RAPSA|nr:uncharacterized protein LOC130508491 [Raphanus sativus]